MQLSEESARLLRGLDLKQVLESPRRAALKRLESYGSGQQYAKCQFNWNGCREYPDGSEVAPGYYVSISQRRPSVRAGMTETCVAKLTEHAMSEDRLPVISVQGDPEAEHYVRAIAKASDALARISTARGYGGVAGAVMLSYAFIDGRPCVEVHKTFELDVLEWEDPRLGTNPVSVLKLRKFDRVIDGEKREFFYLRFWSPTEEAVAEVPFDNYDPRTWFALTEWTVTVHGAGRTPVVWIQNRTCESPDGDPDLSEDSRVNSESLDRLLSATLKGTVANVDPTLVIKMDPATNYGTVRKGSDNAIFSPGGADYLELSGSAAESALKQAVGLVKMIFDQAGVVIPEQERLTATASSGEALRLLYKPMTSRCDAIRRQYGDQGLRRLLEGLLIAAKRNPGQVVLPPRIEVVRDESGASVSTKEVPVTPGRSEQISLAWPPYFLPSASDAAAIVNVAKAAIGVLVSPRTAIRSVQGLGIFKIEDPETEFIDILAAREALIEASTPEDDPEDPDSSA